MNWFYLAFAFVLFSASHGRRNTLRIGFGLSLNEVAVHSVSTGLHSLPAICQVRWLVSHQNYLSSFMVHMEASFSLRGEQASRSL